MARKRVVSRTVTVTVATVMYANAQALTFEEKVLQIQGEYKTTEELMKVINKKYHYDGLVPTAIKSTTTADILYEMDEDDFIAQARIVPGGR